VFFQSGNPTPSDAGQELLLRLAHELGQLPNDLLIEGHTDAKPFNGRGGYSNWELSADRANAARRYMTDNGLRPGQVVQVRGFADRNLRVQDDPEAASNRRISVIVKYQSPPSGEPSEAEEKGSEGKAPAAKHD